MTERVLRPTALVRASARLTVILVVSLQLSLTAGAVAADSSDSGVHSPMSSARPASTVHSTSAAQSASAASASAAAASAASGSAPSGLTPASAVAGLPAIPSRWPSANFEIGLMDSPGGAADLHSSGSYKFRYQYLCAGVNTGTGWSTWNAGAKFADYYVDESIANNITPVFIYYQMLQSKPGIDDLNAHRLDERHADLENLANATTMRAYWADVRLLFQHLGAYSKPIVIDVEPDLWGYIEQASTGDNASTVPVAVTGSGDADVAGLADNGAGFAQAFIRLRNKYAPNVLLGYHMSTWGTMNDPIAQDIPLDQIGALADRAANFELSTGAAFDLSFGDPADRDAAFKQYIYGDGGNSWWSATDYQRYDAWNAEFIKRSGLRMVLWQIPLGNTKMRAMNNTWGHYQDNHVEHWLGDGTSSNLTTTIDSGVIALLFGGGADGTTAAADTMGDGVTNPAAINGNTTLSYSADDDGGYFRHQVNAWYGAGAVPLPGAAVTPPKPSTYHPMTPARLLDTRIGRGLSGKFVPNAPRAFAVTGQSSIPSNATAVTGNLTVTNASGGWAVALGPAATAYPATSTINFVAGQTIANGVTVPLAADGKLWATFLGTAGKSIDLVFDVTGYFTPDATGDTFHAIAPARIVDSRKALGVARPLIAGQPASFGVRGVGGVPASAVAVTGNVTVANSTNGWALYLGPAAIAKPATSTLNFIAGEAASNNVTVQLSSDGSLWATFLSSTGATTDIVFDVTGYFTADATGMRYYAVTPTRLLDTRASNGLVGKLGANTPRAFAVAGRGPVPAGIAGVTGNLTVTNETFGWAAYLGPSGAAPTTSTLNFVAPQVKANGVDVALTSAGTLYATYISIAGQTTDLVFDVTGYFAK